MKKTMTLLLAAAVFLSACAAPAAETAPVSAASAASAVSPSPAPEPAAEASSAEDMPVPEPMARPQLMSMESVEAGADTVTASVAPCVIEPDLSNVINIENYSYYPEEFRQKLLENQFVVMGSGGYEFFDIYEYNRYGQVPNFVTVDSMMHTYHLYFSYLLRRTEAVYLSGALSEIGPAMAEESLAQYDALKGTKWEEAALDNAAFFAVGSALMGTDIEIPAVVRDKAEAELALIAAQEGIAESPLFGGYEDYSQYRPRGYYEGDEAMERYFRAMMWYGRRNFAQKDEKQTRSAVLMTLGMEESVLPAWEKLYAVTSFFAGASDDSGYCEYAPIVHAAYGEHVQADDLKENEDAFELCRRMLDDLAAPAINAVPLPDDEGKTDKAEETKGFRFMGQRFTMDGAIFRQLCYSVVKPSDSGEKRLLPGALDVPAALGSDDALAILAEQGMTNYPNYGEQMEKVRAMIKEAPESTWEGSLYAGWMKTLLPLLEKKGEGYPTFMQSAQWRIKNLESFMGSFTELKHDTVLYSKQFMAEMGGGWEEDVDDRGFVEPEPVIYDRLRALSDETARGLLAFDMIEEQDVTNLSRLSLLAESLKVISEKELREELLTDEEYELIRTYGGQLEHFWADAIRDRSGDAEYLDSQLFPSAVVVDVATDPNGRVLEIATGIPSNIYVIVSVEGKPRIAEGSVFTYYEFEQPISERLTDSTWRRMLGVELISETEGYRKRDEVAQPSWTQSYRARGRW